MVILPIIIPPKFARFNKIIPTTFKNNLSKIENINNEIVTMNKSCGQPMVAWLNTYGIRNSGNKRSHRFNEWREKDISRKLHLIGKMKVSAALEIGKYFAVDQ